MQLCEGEIKPKLKCVCTPFKLSRVEYPQVWEELRQSGQLCDGVVRCKDGAEIRIHRVILAAASPYFRALFSNSINRNRCEKFEAFVDCPNAVFRDLLDYAYTGTCAITADNVEDVLKHADRYQILAVVQLCCRYLMDQLTPRNCIGIWFFAGQYFCQNLLKKVKFYVKSNFTDVIAESDEYLELLDFHHLHEILVDDELNVKNEELAFTAAVKWVNYKLEGRIDHLDELIKSVRLGLLTNKSLKRVLRNTLIRKRTECRQYLEESIAEINDMSNYERMDLSRRMFRPRISFDVLFAIGGWTAGSPTNFFETYDFRADRWLLSYDTDCCARAYHGLCVLKNMIYVIGGFDGTQYFNTVRRFDPVGHAWADSTCMYYQRCYVSVVTYDCKIYAMGGYNGRTRMNSVERFDAGTNQWEMMAPMKNIRSDASAAVMHDKIYIVGGFNGEEVMRSAEVFNVKENQWSYIPQMISPRSGVSLVACNNALYALGGFDGNTRLTSGEKLVPGQFTWWSEINSMVTPRSNFATVLLDDLIYVIGGFNGSTTVNYVEYYDTENEKWYDVSSMNLNRSALGACIISGLPNVVDYSVLGRKRKTKCHGDQLI